MWLSVMLYMRSLEDDFMLPTGFRGAQNFFENEKQFDYT